MVVERAMAKDITKSETIMIASIYSRFAFPGDERVVTGDFINSDKK
jgi:hypothetical protein